MVTYILTVMTAIMREHESNFVPEISWTTYKFRNTFQQEEILCILRETTRWRQIAITWLNFEYLHKLFTSKLPKREIPSWDKETDINSTLWVMRESRYRRWPESYMDEYKDLKSILENNIKNKKDFMQLWRFSSKDELHIALPAFANKSFNPLRNTRKTPDLWEIRSLLHLHYMCKDLSNVYWARVKLKIIMDGIVYAPIFNEPMDVVFQYKQELEKLISITWCSNLSIIDMSELLPSFKNFDSTHQSTKERVSKNRHLTKNTPAVNNLISNTKHNLNLSMYSIEDLVWAIVYETNIELHNIIKDRAEKSALEYLTFVQTLYSEEIVKKSFPNSIRATCHPKPWQRWIHLVWKGSYNYPYNGVPFRDWNKVTIVNEIDMLINKDIYWVHIQWDEKPIFYIHKKTKIDNITYS